MKPEFILMLTHNDQTVSDALEVFEANQDTPVTHWGFKDVGLPPTQMQAVVQAMKNAGKTTFLEVVSLSEAEGVSGAKLAVELGFDILMGTVYYDSILEYLSDKPVRYFPFPGHVFSHPSILDGTIAEITADACRLEACGAAGLDLLTYRYRGEAPQLLRSVTTSTHVPVVSAGSIASFERIGEVWAAGAWGFTIGTALFEKKFVPEGSFRENILAVCDWLERTSPADLPAALRTERMETE